LAVAIFATAPLTQALILYDGSLDTTPDTQGWLTYAVLSGSPNVSATGGELIFDTTSTPSEVAFYTNHQPTVAGNPLVNPAFPPMPRSGAGTMIRLDLQVLDESHTNSTAGFSWNVITDDERGFELDFWKDHIWGSGPTHVLEESTVWDTTSGLIQYDLNISGDTYTLETGSNVLLTGPLRDYRPFNLSNVVSIGDNTGAAGAKVAISRLEILPEPALMGVIAAIGLLVRRR
jgi:hypothetical protein